MAKYFVTLQRLKTTMNYNVTEKKLNKDNDKEQMNRPPKLDQKSNNWEVGFFMAKYSFEFKKKVK